MTTIVPGTRSGLGLERLHPVPPRSPNLPGSRSARLAAQKMGPALQKLQALADSGRPYAEGAEAQGEAGRALAGWTRDHVLPELRLQRGELALSFARALAQHVGGAALVPAAAALGALVGALGAAGATVVASAGGAGELGREHAPDFPGAKVVAQLLGVLVGGGAGVVVCGVAGVGGFFLGAGIVAGEAYKAVQAQLPELERSLEDAQSHLRAVAALEDAVHQAANSGSGALQARLARVMVDEGRVGRAVVGAIGRTDREGGVRAAFARALVEDVPRQMWMSPESRRLAAECALAVTEARSPAGAAQLLWHVAERYSAEAEGQREPFAAVPRIPDKAPSVPALQFLPLVLGPALGDHERREVHEAAGVLFEALLTPEDGETKARARALPASQVGQVGRRLDLSVPGIDLLWRVSSSPEAQSLVDGALFERVLARKTKKREALSAMAEAVGRAPALGAVLAAPVPAELADDNADAAGVLGAHAVRLSNGIVPLRSAYERLAIRPRGRVVSPEGLQSFAARRGDLYAWALAEGLEARWECIERAAASFSAWREGLGRAGNRSSGTTQREATVALVSLGLALIAGEHPSTEVASRLLGRLPEVARFVGRSDIAKHGLVRSALVNALFNLVSAFELVPEGHGSASLGELSNILAQVEAVEPRRAVDTAREITAELVALEAKLQSTWGVAPEELGRIEDRLGPSNRHGKALVSYLRRQQEYLARGEEAGPLIRVIKSLAEGRLGEERRVTLEDGRLREALPADERSRLGDILTRWNQAEQSAVKGLFVFDSGEPLDWVEAVDTISSCQRTDGTLSLNKGLLNRFLDGTIRLLAARDTSGAIVARAAGRLAVTTRDGETRLALFLDRIYPKEQANASRREALLVHAAARARALGIECALSEPVPGHEGQIVSASIQFPEGVGPDYRDHSGSTAWLLRG